MQTQRAPMIMMAKIQTHTFAFWQTHTMTNIKPFSTRLAN